MDSSVHNHGLQYGFSVWNRDRFRVVVVVAVVVVAVVVVVVVVVVVCVCVCVLKTKAMPHGFVQLTTPKFRAKLLAFVVQVKGDTDFNLSINLTTTVILSQN